MASLIADISDLIGDPTNIQWTYAEVRLSVIESLRLWGLLTNYWKARGTFDTAASTAWYDLSVQLPALRARTITVNDIVTEIQYHCFEQANGLSGAGMTSQFTVSEMVQAVIRGRNRLVADAGLPLTVNPPLAFGADVFSVPDQFAWIRHGYWIDSDGSYWPLRRVDPWSETGYTPSWTIDPGRPIAFSMAEYPPLDISLYPPPLGSGMLEWISADSNALSATDAAQTLLLPDEFAPAAKYSAIADLFSMDGETNDPLRADYCEKRYQQYVTAALFHRSIVDLRVNNVPIGCVPLSNLDSKSPNWRMSYGKPRTAGTDIDLVGLADVPDGVYSVTADVITPAPIPASDNLPLQIGRELIGLIFGYAQHYLSNKLGGSEFSQTFSGLDDFMKAAAQRNSQMKKYIQFQTPLFDQQAKEQGMQMGVQIA